MWPRLEEHLVVIFSHLYLKLALFHDFLKWFCSFLGSFKWKHFNIFSMFPLKMQVLFLVNGKKCVLCNYGIVRVGERGRERERKSVELLSEINEINTPFLKCISALRLQEDYISDQVSEMEESNTAYVRGNKKNRFQSQLLQLRAFEHYNFWGHTLAPMLMSL